MLPYILYLHHPALLFPKMQPTHECLHIPFFEYIPQTLYGRILDLICEDYTKGQILDELGLGKSQGYADIKAAQALAKKLYFGE